MVKNGLRVSFHSDFMMAPMEPLLLAWCAASRITQSGRQVSPEERLTLEQALRGITIDAAFGLNLDHDIGSIVAGKKADFTVLDDDPYELGVDGLKDVRVAGTVFEGELHLLPKALASVLAGSGAARSRVGALPPAATRLTSEVITSPASFNPARYRPMAPICCDVDGDPCVFVRQLSGWMGSAQVVA